MLQLSIKNLHNQRFHFRKGKWVILPHGPRYDQGGPGFINQDGIRLIDDAKVVVSLHLVISTSCHSIIPKVIKAKF